MEIIPLHKNHYLQVSKIYEDGMATGIATFETEVPSWEAWNERFLPVGRLVVLHNNQVAAWCAFSAISKRPVYKGVVENTIYVGEKFRNIGIGKALLLKQIEEV